MGFLAAFTGKKPSQALREKLPQSRCARQPPLGWGLWHSGTVSDLSAKFVGVPEAPSGRELAKPSGFD